MMHKRMPSGNNIKVSVVIPAYNASKFINEAIESVLLQDYAKFELLILDDGSTDGTFDIIKKYKCCHRVKIYRNKKNEGPGAARNKLLHFATGEYITPCDADDIILPGNLRTLSKFLDTHPNIGAVYGDILVIESDNKGRIVKPPSICGDDCNKKWDIIMNTINYAGSMIRKSLMLKVGGADESVYSSQGWALFLKLAEITKIKYLKNQVYYVYRRHPKGVSKSKKWRRDALRAVSSAIKRRYNRNFKI